MTVWVTITRSHYQQIQNLKFSKYCISQVYQISDWMVTDKFTEEFASNKLNYIVTDII